MCLRTKQICPLRARRDIVCYKAFHADSYHFIRTLYMTHCIKRPTEGHPTLIDDTDIPLSILRVRSSFTGKMKYQIFGGMIHAYKTKADADAIHLPRVIMYKCIIPKGTLYYVGTEGDICAKKMLVVEKVNPNTAG